MSKLIRIGTYSIDEVLPYVFTSEMRRKLVKGYRDKEWISASRKMYKVPGKEEGVVVAMGSHRYQMFAEKGITCVFCGLEGKFFALEKNISSVKYHFNLYGIDNNGKEIMLTKDHIIPRSKGGKNVLSNYQPLCIKCNLLKADQILC